MREPFKCCINKTPKTTKDWTGWKYNRLEGKEREWAKENQLPLSEYCVPVKGGKKFGGPRWIKDKCGNGRTGFSSRRKNTNETRMERGLEGQWKRKRSTLVRPKSARTTSSRRARRIDGSKITVVSQVEIAEMRRDPLEVNIQRIAYKKSNRARNRNNGARRGHKRAARIAAKRSERKWMIYLKELS